MRKTILITLISLLSLVAFGQEPACSANGVSVTSITSTSFTVNWNNGCGDTRMVVVGKTSICDPNDYQSYQFNNQYGFSGQTRTCSDTYVVYIGSGTSVNVSGLTSNTSYYIKVIEFTSSILDYRTFDAPTTTQSTSGGGGGGGGTQTSNITFSNIQSTQVTVMASQGNGDKTLIVAKQGQSLTETPISGSNYCNGTNPVTFGSTLMISSGVYVVATVGSSACGCPTTTLPVTITGLSPGTYYTFRGYEANGGSCSPTYDITTTTNNPNTVLTLPGSPSTNPATSISQTGFTAQWSSTGVVTGHYLDVSTSNTFGSFVPGFSNLDVSSVTSYAITSLTAGTTYYYRVRAYNSSGTSTNSDTRAVSLIPPAPISSPSSSATQTSFTANWTGATGATGYYLDVSTSNTFGSFVSGYSSKDVGNVLSYAVSPLTAGTTYYYRIRAYNSGGASGNSGTVTALTVPLTPNPSSATTVTQTSFSANWSAVASATAYYLDVSTSNSFGSFVGSYNNLAIGNVTTFAVSGLSGGTTYYYRLRSANSAGSSPSSGSQNVLTIPTNPTANPATSITQTSFTANWSSVSGATGYWLDVSTDNFSSFVTGYNNKSVSGSQAVSGLNAGTAYQYRVRASNATGTSGVAGAISVTTIPATPVINNATSVTQTGFTASWSTSTGASGYALDISADNFATFISGYNGKSVTITSESVSGLSSGITYYVRVRSVNSSGSSGNSNTVSQITIPPTPAPGVSAITSTSFDLSWPTSEGASNYRLDVSDNNAFSTFVSGYSDLLVNTNTKSVTGLSATTLYFYRVRSANAAGTSSSSATGSQYTLTLAPTAVAATAITDVSFTANWTTVSGATSYRVDVASDINFTNPITGYANLSASGTSTSVSGLANGTTYYYRIRGVNAGGQSSNSNTVTITTVPAAPNVGTATLITTSSFVANWSASAGATEYRLDVYTGTSLFVAGYQDLTVNGTSQSVTGLQEGVTYNYRVRAVNSSGTSANSQAVSVITVPPVPPALPPSAIGASSFTANWTAVSGATEYVLDVTQDDFSTFLSGYNGKILTTTSEVISGLSSNTLYKYRVRAKSSSGISANSSAITALTLPSTPQNVNTTSVGQTGFSASWNAITGITEFLVEVSTTDFVSNLADYNNLIISTNSVAVTNLAPGVAHKFRVRAKNASGASSYSLVQTVLTIPANPVANAATNVTETSFTVSWSAIAGSSGYFLDVSTSSSFNTFLDGYNAKAISLVQQDEVTPLFAGVTYYYRLRSTNATGTSGNSNVISQITLPSKPTANSPSQITANSFLASWGEVTGAVAYELDVFSEADNYVTPITGYNAKTVSGVTEEFVRNLLASTQYKYRVRAKNAAGVSAYSALRLALTLTSTGTVSNPPQASVGTPATSTSVRASVSGGIPPYTITLFHKKITESTFASDAPVTSSSATADFTTPASFFDELGMEYYFKVVDDGGRESTSASAKKFVSFETATSEKFLKGPFDGSRSSIKIISIPYQLNNNSIESVFGSLGVYDKKTWRLAHYQNGRNIEYQSPGFPDLARGLGFWFNSKVDASSLTTGAGTVGTNDQNNPFKLELVAGWNQIGNPYPFDIDWSDVLADNPGASGVGNLKVYNGATQNFVNTDDLKKFEGAFVLATGAVTLDVNVNLKNRFAAGRKKNDEPGNDPTQSKWFIPLKITQGKSIFEMSGFGMNPDALPSKDNFDDMRPPRLPDYLDGTFIHEEYKFPDFASDVVTTSLEHSWDFEVSSSIEDEEIFLAWDNTGLVSSNVHMYMLNIETAELIDMKTAASHSFLGARTRFKIFFSRSSDQISPGMTIIGKAFPNPTRGMVTVNFTLPDNDVSYATRVDITDNFGRIVATPLNEQVHGGAHSIDWNADTESPGVYFMRIAVDGRYLPNCVQRIVLTK